MIELLIALVILIIGVLGVLSLQQTVMQGASISKHAGQASYIAEHQLESLRVDDPAALATIAAAPLSQVVDDLGNLDANGFFTRNTTVTVTGDLSTVVVAVVWREPTEDADRNVTAIAVMSN